MSDDGEPTLYDEMMDQQAADEAEEAALVASLCAFCWKPVPEEHQRRLSGRYEGQVAHEFCAVAPWGLRLKVRAGVVDLDAEGVVIA